MPEAAKRFAATGYHVFRNVLAAGDCVQLRKQTLQLLDGCAYSPGYNWARWALPGARLLSTRLEPVRAPWRRHCLTLPPSAALAAATRAAARIALQVGLPPSSVLVESDATLVLPGAGRQGEHADISPSVPDAGKAAPLVTVWVALQDVTEVMGPTTILPGSHLRYRTRATLEEADEEERAGPNYSADGEENGPSRPNLVTLYQDDDNAAAQWAMGEQMDAADRAHEAREDAEFGADIPAEVRLVLSQGDAGIMDCRVRHFGGAYPYLWDGPPRVLLNATFGVAERVRGFTYHQHDERLALRTLADLLAEE